MTAKASKRSRPATRTKGPLGDIAARLGAVVAAIACWNALANCTPAANPPAAGNAAIPPSAAGAESSPASTNASALSNGGGSPNNGGGQGPRTPASRTRDNRTDSKADTARVREGTRWQNQRGFFTLVGDRVTFTTTDRAANFVALENLNLERVVKTLEESRTVADSDKLEWVVDGMVTEYRGANFLSVTRSVLVTRPRKVDVVQ